MIDWKHVRRQASDLAKLGGFVLLLVVTVAAVVGWLPGT